MTWGDVRRLGHVVWHAGSEPLWVAAGPEGNKWLNLMTGQSFEGNKQIDAFELHEAWRVL